jgi:hypothetical protein
LAEPPGRWPKSRVRGWPVFTAVSAIPGSSLAEIDALSVRPLRAIAQDEATEYDREKLTVLDAEAEPLRTELATLQ